MTAEERAAAVYQAWGAHETVATIKDGIAAAIREAVAEERDRCARICEQVQTEADERCHETLDQSEGANGASVAAGRIRAGGD
jgi:hypothetical protein